LSFCIGVVTLCFVFGVAGSKQQITGGIKLRVPVFRLPSI
jgi:hypothetical protein